MSLRDDLLTSIAGENPSGANLRYDPVIDAIKEARREDLDIAQGEWKTSLKTADYAQVIKLAGDVLARRSKDLQIAAWLVDAHIRRDGFTILAPCFEFLAKLIDQFWDTLYPEIEEDDVELRAAPLEWLGTRLENPVCMLPITAAGLSFFDYKQSRVIGYEQDASNDEKKRIREQAIADHKPTAEDFDAAVSATTREFYQSLQDSLASALEKLQSLSDLCDRKFGPDYSPSFVKTRTAIEAIANQTRIFLTKKAPPPSSPVSAPAPALIATVTPAAPAAAPVIAAPPPVSVPSSQAAPTNVTAAEPDGLEDAIRRAAVICRYLREKTIYDASAYLMIRAFRWGELRAKSPDIDPAMLHPPSADLRSALKGRFVAGAWDEVLNLTEQAMELPCGRAWLDLQRYTVQALENKDAYYAGVGASIRVALRALLEELPGLLDQTMTDDTPLANPETRTWINEQVLSGAPLLKNPPHISALASTPSAAPAITEIPARPPDLEPDEDRLPGDVFEQALAAVQSGRAEAALESIYKQLASERSGRGRFRRRTQLAHLLMLGGHEHIALPILQQLAAEIEQRRLADWEYNEALAYPVDLLIRCLDANGGDPDNRKDWYARLCQLDPLRALKSPTP